MEKGVSILCASQPVSSCRLPVWVSRNRIHPSDLANNHVERKSGPGCLLMLHGRRKCCFSLMSPSHSRVCVAKRRKLSKGCNYSDSLTQMLRGRCGINNERTQRRLFIIKSSLRVLITREAAKATKANGTNQFPPRLLDYSPTQGTDGWISELRPIRVKKKKSKHEPYCKRCGLTWTRPYGHMDRINRACLGNAAEPQSKREIQTKARLQQK